MIGLVVDFCRLYFAGQVLDGTGTKGFLAVEKLVEDNSEGPDIGFLIEVSVFGELLWRHVG